MPLDISEQIKKRKTYDAERVSDAFVGMSGVVAGEMHDMFSEEKLGNSENAVKAVLKYFGIKDKFIFSPDASLNDQLAEVFQPRGVMFRTVKLTDGWYKDGFGVYIGTLKNGSIVALVPSFSGYSYIDSATGKSVKIDKKNADEVGENAICFYRPFPQRKMTKKDLYRFTFESLGIHDTIKIVVFTALATLAAMIIPLVTSFIYNEVVFTGEYTQLILSFVMMVAAYFTVFGFNQLKGLYMGNIVVKMNAVVFSASMMRLLSMPMDFFNKYPSGTINKWMLLIASLSANILNFVLSTVLGAVMCLMYVFQVFTVDSALVLPTLLFLILQVIFSGIAVYYQSMVFKNSFEGMGEEEGFLYSMLGGIPKIRISGAENRVFASWAEKYKKVAKNDYDPPFAVKYYEVINIAISLLASLAIYIAAMKSGVSGAEYMVFLSIFGLLTASLTSLTTASMAFSQVPATLKIVKPFFEEEPEVFENRKVVKKLTGAIQIRNLKFRYSKESRWILDDLSLDIAPGSYVAIVGKSGCGKSTLLKLMLGLEKAESGSIFYDNNDINAVDIRSIRRRIGTVMQNATLFPGTLRYNISINAPGCTDEEIMDAVRLAGLEDVVKRLPMGLETIISGSGGGLSGGQAQRVAIARALIRKPDILVLDEATSALDNITQRIVVDSLDSIKCTRVVVAHRLSTIKTCDRIVMLEGGNIIEDGTYDELMEKGGEFAKLVKRQQI